MPVTHMPFGLQAWMICMNIPMMILFTLTAYYFTHKETQRKSKKKRNKEEEEERKQGEKKWTSTTRSNHFDIYSTMIQC